MREATGRSGQLYVTWGNIDYNGGAWPLRRAAAYGKPRLTRAAALGENELTSKSFLQVWACGAAGSALPWHGRGRRFDPDQVHQILLCTSFTSYRVRATTSSTLVGQREFPPDWKSTIADRLYRPAAEGLGCWFIQEQFESLKEARQRERQIKRWKSHRSIQELIDASNN